MTTITADPVTDDAFELGEGPIWLAPDRLTFVDILENALLVASAAHGAVRVERRYDVGRHLGAALPLATPDEGWILAAASGFAHLAPDGTVRVLAEAESGRRGVVRMNDAKCDPVGRLWAGSMAYDERPEAGSLFRVDLDGTLTRVLRGRQVSNGIDWSPDGRTMYYSDSGHRVVYQGAYDVDRGELGELRPLLEPAPELGAPDGLTVDAEGMLWVAFWGGGAVRRYDTSGRLLAEVRTGAPQTTSCCLGGADGRTLFITSAATGLSAEELAGSPLSGRLFAVEVDVPGPPASPFRGALPEPQEAA
jgi:sugar lactone lactonase YvrE